MSALESLIQQSNLVTHAESFIEQHAWMIKPYRKTLKIQCLNYLQKFHNEGWVNLAFMVDQVIERIESAKPRWHINTQETTTTQLVLTNELNGERCEIPAQAIPMMLSILNNL